ncbi:MAG TPA: hypothetical protein VGI56_06095 [Galbitalea sp.]
MPKSAAVVASALLLAVSFLLTGCTEPSAPVAQAAKATLFENRTYSSDELTAIVTEVESSLDVKGTVLTDATIKAKIAGAGLTGGLSTLVAQDHATFAPAACAKLVGSVGGGVQTLPTGEHLASAELVWGKLTLAVSAIPNEAIPNSVAATYLGEYTSLLQACPTMTISVASGKQHANVKASFTKIGIHTTADQTVALEEEVLTGGGKGGTGSVEYIVQAVKGNLVIEAVGVTDDFGSVTAAVEATVAAAKSLKLPTATTPK